MHLISHITTDKECNNKSAVISTSQTDSPVLGTYVCTCLGRNCVLGVVQFEIDNSE